MHPVFVPAGQAADAIREYARVKDQFADAAQAIEYFQRREVKLPEVTTLEPEDKPVVELTFRKYHEGSGLQNYFWKARPAA